MRDKDATVEYQPQCGGEGLLASHEEHKLLLSPHDDTEPDTATVLRCVSRACARQPDCDNVKGSSDAPELVEQTNGCPVTPPTDDLPDVSVKGGGHHCKMPSDIACCPGEPDGGSDVPREAVNHRFYLPTDGGSDEDSEPCRAEEVTSPAGSGAPAPPRPQQTSPSGRVGVKLHGARHVFTVVPVDTTELRRDKIEEEPDEDEPLLTSSSSFVVAAPSSSSGNVAPLPLSCHPSSSSSHYNTVRGCAVGRRAPAYSPYQTVTGVGNGSRVYNPYHTITGMHPCSYQRLDNGLFRVPTTLSRREYGIGGSTYLFPRPEYVGEEEPPKGVAAATTTTTTPAVGLHRVSTLPNPKTNPYLPLRQVFTQQWGALPPLPDDAQHEQLTTQPANQLTVHSGVSIDVGSTDGYNMTVRGAVVFPDQLSLIPPVARNGLKDEGSSGAGGNKPRQTWGNKAQFMLACVGSAVGLGNLWRFPYLCYKSGGGAFLIPYFLMLFVCGIPLLLMELAVGQYTRRGPIAAMEKICPLFKGAGVGTVIISFLLSTYYNVIIAWAIFYFVQSFSTKLPWNSCNATWAINCFDDYGSNITAPNGTKSPTEEFFDEVVLQKSEGIHEMGSMQTELLLALLGAWVLVYFSLWKSVKSSGRVVYVTATLPYLLIGAFLWRAVTLPGATIGLQYFFGPRWELLLDAEVWVSAAAQNFNSIGIAFGSIIAYASYNKFNNNIIVDTWTISIINSFTSLLAGIIIFSTLGNISEEQGKDIDDVVAEGPGLVFMVYPQALAKMPYSSVWAVLFFLMLLILGLDSQFATVEVIITSLQDGFPDWIRRHLKHHEILVLITCFVSFLFGLPNIMQGGIYFFQLVDYYAAAISLMYLAFFEVIAIVWVYGAGRLARNVREMTGRLPSWYFRFCWYFAAPMLILAIWIFSMVDYKQPTYNKGEYKYPDWAIGVGWIISSLSIAPIPIFAIIAIVKAKGTNIFEKLKNSIRSPIDECPCCGRAFNCLEEGHNHGHESLSHQVKLVVYNPQENNLENKSSPSTKENSIDTTETKMNGENA